MASLLFTACRPIRVRCCCNVNTIRP